MKKPKGFFTYFQHAQVIEEFSDEEAGKVYKALLRYGMSGELPDFGENKMIRIAFKMFQADVDENFERYRTTCENRQKAAIERERRKAQAYEIDSHNCDDCD